MSEAGTFYVTTAIDYPNGAPHLGHAYEKIVSDAYARWYRLLGREVWFLTGTDENGQKLAKAAADAGVETRRYLDEQVQGFRALCERLAISHDDFIRTTEERHVQATVALWKKLEEKGDIYFDKYSGHYCLACEAFYPKSQAPDLKCPQHHTPLTYVEEEGFFFRLSKYEDWIKRYLEETKGFVEPQSARSEMLGRLRAEPLRDLSISRPSAGWGIPVPSRPDHVVYTWFDALINYYAAVTEPAPHAKRHLWPADMHVIGKDITWFHTVIWPVMLHAAGIAPPKQVWVHGMVLDEHGRKMSKSLGNGVDPMEMVDKYGVETFRYYILRAIAAGQDGAFSEADLKQRHNSELANVYGNTFMRVVKFTLKKFGGTLPPPDAPLDLDMRKIKDRMVEAMDAREHNRALDALWDGLNEVNAYLNQKEPWRIKDDDATVRRCVYSALHAMHALGALVTPFLPATGQRTLKMLGVPQQAPLAERFEPATFVFGEPETLFPRFE